jgi:hypothetical protein
MAPLLEDMVHLAAWTALLGEAADQERTEGRSLKRAAADLFRRRFLTSRRAQYDVAELELIGAVVEWKR